MELRSISAGVPYILDRWTESDFGTQWLEFELNWGWTIDFAITGLFLTLSAVWDGYVYTFTPVLSQIVLGGGTQFFFKDRILAYLALAPKDTPSEEPDTPPTEDEDDQTPDGEEPDGSSDTVPDFLDDLKPDLPDDLPEPTDDLPDFLNDA